MLAGMTGLGAGIPLVYFDQVFALLFSLIVQLGYEAMPGCISNMSGQLAVLHHVFDLQRLDNHRLVIVNDLAREFVLKVIASVNNPLMSFGNEQSGFGPVGTAFLGTGQCLLFAP